MVESVLGNGFKCIWTPGTPIFGGQDRIFSGLQTFPVGESMQTAQRNTAQEPRTFHGIAAEEPHFLTPNW